MLFLIFTYEVTSGQLLNKEKSFYFNSIIPKEVRTTITKIARTRAHGNLEKYLGLPSCLGRNKAKHFQFLLNKTWPKISNWKNNFLLGVGRAVLLKAVLQTLSIYIMSIIFT